MSPLITKKEALSIYKKLLTARLAEEKIRQEYHGDEMKTPVHMGIGGEAIPVGVLHCLPKGTKTFGTYRNHALFLTATDGDTNSFFGEMYGKVTGPGKGKAGSMHLMAPEHGLMATSAVVGTTIPLAVGAALANSYKQSKENVVTFFGDGAVEEGVFWESLNFACLHRLRILFVCEDNDLAIHTPKSQRRGFPSLRATAKTFSCYTSEGDGTDVLEVIKLTKGVLKQMSRDPKPALLCLSYFRFLEHVGPKEDFDAGYRPKPSRQKLQRLDPVRRFERDLLRKDFVASELDAVQQEVRGRIDRSVQAARQAPFAPAEELFMDVLT